MTYFKWFIAFTILSLIGGWFFSEIPLERLSKSAQSLLWVGMTLFAILGVWISILDPSQVLDRKPSENKSNREQLGLDLFYPWLVSTFVFASSFVIIFILSFLPLYTCNSYIKGAFSFIICFLFLLNLYALLGTLVPIARIQRKIKISDFRQKYRKK